MNTHHIHIVLLFVLAITFFISCSSDELNVNEDVDYRRTVIIYMAAQNSLGAKGAHRLDSMEIVAGVKRLNSRYDNVVLFIDDGAKPRIYQCSMNSPKPRLLKRYNTDLDSTDPNTLLDVLQFTKAKFPSTKSYGLIFWSHGTGWIYDKTPKAKSSSYKGNVPESYGVDVGPDGNMAQDLNKYKMVPDGMDIYEISDAIQKSGIHFDFIYWDACLMQCIETAYELRKVTDYMVGCPVTTSGYGVYYTNTIPQAFFAYPTNDANISKLVDQYYYNAMDNPETKNLYSDLGCVISAIKTEHLEELAAKTALYLPYTDIVNRKSVDISKIQRYLDYKHWLYPDYCDMQSAMHNLLSESQYADWKTSLDKCVIYHKASDSIYVYTQSDWELDWDWDDDKSFLSGDVYYRLDSEDLCGVSMFIPQNNYGNSYNLKFKYTEWYKDAGWEATGW